MVVFQLTFIIFLLQLVLVTRLGASSQSLSCDRWSIRSIDSTFISYATSNPPDPQNSCSVYDLLSNQDCTFWCLPYTLIPSVDIFFKQTLILEGLSTQGNQGEGFVRQFSVLYSPTVDEPLIPLNTIGLPNANGYTIFFSEPIVVRHLQLIINVAVVIEDSYFYYWHTDIIGCTVPPPTNTTGNDSGSQSNDDHYDNVTVISSVSLVEPSAAVVILSSNDILTEPTISEGLSPSTESTCSDTTLSVTIRQTTVTTRTVTITTTSTQLLSPGTELSSFVSLTNGTAVDSSSNVIDTANCYFYSLLMLLAVLVVILVTVIICVGVVGIGIWRKKYGSKKRSSTLLEVPNSNLYELGDSVKGVMHSRTASTPMTSAHNFTNTRRGFSTTTASLSVNPRQRLPTPTTDLSMMKTPLISDQDDNYDELSHYRLPADAISADPPSKPSLKSGSADTQYATIN